MKIKIDWAKDEDAAAIQALLAEDGVDLRGGMWVGIGRTWLVARAGENVLGCVAYHPGRPIARLDFLSVRPEVRGLSKVRLVRDILDAGFAVAALHGASFVTGAVSYTDVAFGTFLTKHGGRAVNEGWLYVAALGEVLKDRNKVHGRRKNDIDHDSHANG